MRRIAPPPQHGLLIAAFTALVLSQVVGWRALLDEPGPTRGSAEVLAAGTLAEGGPSLPVPEALVPIEAVTDLLASTGVVAGAEGAALWTLEGRVLDDCRLAVPGARVSLGARQVQADAEGWFAFRDLYPLDDGERARVVARADGHVAGRHELRGPMGRPGDISPGRLTFMLDHGAALTGQILRADGRAVVGARVEARRDPARPEEERDCVPDAPVGSSEQSTGADGRFLFECVDVGRWRVTAEVAGLIPAEVRLDLFPGQFVACPPLVLGEPASLVGRVVDRLGAPVAGAEVRFERCDKPVRTDAPHLLIEDPAGLVSGADGSFRVTALAPGTWRVGAIPPAGMVGPMPGVSEVVLAAGDAAELEVRLAEPRRLRGVVLDDAGLPVAGMEVEAVEVDLLNWRRISPRALTDGLGRFVVEVAPGADVTLSGGLQARRLSYWSRVPHDAPADQLVELRPARAQSSSCISLRPAARR